MRIDKSFARAPVLRDVSLRIESGETVALIGPSGCGKSTLLRIVAGLETQDSGEVRIGDVAVDGLRPKERDVAMVFQNYALYPHLSVYDNLATPLRMRRLEPRHRLPLLGRLSPGRRMAEQAFRGEVAAVAQMLGLDKLLDRKPAQLSGGQRQRVALGRAIVRNPAIFLMDEPLSNLDAKLREETRAELVGLNRSLGATCLYVTHDATEAMTMADRIAVMMEGAVLQIGPPDAIYNDPRHLRVAQAIGSPRVNVLPAAVRDDGQLELRGAALPLRVASGPSRVTLALRPQACSLTAASAPGRIAGRVRHVENLGADLFVHVAAEGLSAPIIVRGDPAAAANRQIGADVFVVLDIDRLLCFESNDGRRLPLQRLAMTPALC